jgi:hypothetical protein
VLVVELTRAVATRVGDEGGASDCWRGGKRTA